MRDYGKVHLSFWTDERMQSCSEGAQRLALYLLTGQHSNAAGAFALPDGYAAEDLRIAVKAVRERFAELSAKGFVKRFADGKHVVVCKYLEYNPPENANVLKAIVKALKAIDGLARDPAFQWVESGLRAAAAKNPKAFPDGVETVLEGLGKPLGEPFGKQSRIPEPEPKPEPNPKPEPKPDSLRGDIVLPGTFDEFWLEYPRKVEKNGATKAYEKAVKAGATPAEICEGARRYALWCEEGISLGKHEEKFVKHPTTWLNNGCWSDELRAWDGPRQRTGGMSAAAGIDFAARSTRAAGGALLIEERGGMDGE
jgi:hypothetical protein